MKLVFVTSHLTMYGGGGIVLRDYANIFCEKGHSITIIAQKVNNNMYRFKKEINIIEVGGPLPSNPLYWLEFYKIRGNYLKAINQVDSDLIIAMHFPSSYICSNLKRKKERRYLYYCLEPFRYFHDKKFYSSAPFLMRIISPFLRIFFKKYDIIGARSANKMICISNFTKMRAKEFYGRDSIVHYIGVDIKNKNDIHNNYNLREELMLKKNTPIIFTLGLSAHLKGAKELIFIFKKILRRKPEVVLLIGGHSSKPNEKIITRLVKKLNIPNRNIILYGFIDDHLLNSFYAQSTLTFYTAIDESFGLIPLESMKNGTPVIVFEGGPSETVIDGKTGYVIKNIDINNFAQKAIRLIENKELNKEFSLRGKEHVKNNFSKEKSITALENIFKHIIRTNYQFK
ncbi:MAG: glycosyltransferase family 4 protein [Candidatus Thorarchaeota archaeon]